MLDSATAGGRRRRLASWTAFWLGFGRGRHLVIAAVVVAAPAWAQSDTESGGTAPSSGAPRGGAVPSGAAGTATPTGTATQTGAATREAPAPTAGLGGSGPRRSPSPDTVDNINYSGAVDTGGLAFYPGFSGGCAAPGTGIGGGFTQNTLLQPLEAPAGPARSQGRKVRLSVAGSETYTDNLNQNEDGESDFVTQVAPRLDACQSTGRLRGQLTYQLEGVAYAKNSSDSDIYNELSGETTVDVLPGHFYLDANTRYGQSVIDPSLGFSQSNGLGSGGNKTNTWNFNVSPYALQSLGPVGNARLRYRYGQTRYEDPDVPDSQTNAVYFNLDSPSRRQTLTWNVNAVTQKVTRDDSNENRFFDRRGLAGTNNPRDDDNTTYFDQASLQLGLQVTDSLQLIGRGGVQDDYQDDGSNDRWSSPFWSAGFNWSSGTNSLEGRYGHRFYGASYSLRAAHRGRTFDASLEYRERPTSQSRNALNGGSNFSRNTFGPVNSEFDRGVYVDKRWTASIGARTALTETTLSAYQQKREYQTSGIEDDRNRGVSIQTRYQIQPRTAITPRFDWQNSDSGGRRNADDSNGYDRYEAGLLAEHALTPDFRVGVSYVRSWRNGSSNYTENRVTLSFFKGF